MALEHRGWRASRNRTLNHFSVEGVITNPAQRLAGGGSMVTTGARLQKPDHQPLLPSVLLLRLYVTQEYPYNDTYMHMRF